jgi:heavy metal efflux system protein
MEWLTRKATFKALERELEQLQDFGTRINLQAGAGEISQLDQRVFTARLAQYNNMLSQERLLLTRAANNLRVLTGFEGDLQTNAELEPLPLPAFAAPITPLFVEVAQRQLDLERRNLKLSNAQLFPEITAGYFNQEIERIPNFQGLMIGLRVPLWARPELATIRQNKLQVRQAENDLRFEQLRRQNERNNAQAAVEAFRMQWEQYGKLAGAQAVTLQQAARLEFENGNTDFFRFFESVRTAIELQIESLLLLNQYNQAVLEYQFYTE